MNPETEAERSTDPRANNPESFEPWGLWHKKGGWLVARDEDDGVIHGPYLAYVSEADARIGAKEQSENYEVDVTPRKFGN